MAKIALLVGVGEYGPDLSPLPGAVKNVEVVKPVLQSSETDSFDEVKLLLNPNPPVMREAIETLFLDRSKNDLVLLFFSGHIVQDEQDKLYFATSITSRSPKADHIRVSTIPISFVHDLMSKNFCQHQIVIIDGCLGRLTNQDLTEKNNAFSDIKTHLGGVRRAILTSFTFAKNPLNFDGPDCSVYTRYLVEGIRTGAADLDRDGWISVDELHEYTSNKVKAVAPAMKPEFYSAENSKKNLLFKVPIDDQKLQYRKEAETWIRHGEISESGRYLLDQLAERLRLSFEDCNLIESEILKPYQEYQEKLQQYKQRFAKAISNNYPLFSPARDELRDFQQALGLRDEDVVPIEERITLRLVNLSQSEDNADALGDLDHYDQSELNSVPLTSSTASPESRLLPSIQPTNLALVAEDDLSEQTISDGEIEDQSVSPAPSEGLAESTPIGTPASTNPKLSVDLLSSLSSSQTSSPSISTLPKKFPVLIGIGGALAILAVAIGISTRTQVASPDTSASRVSSSPKLSTQTSQTAKNSSKEPSPTPSASPNSNDCSIFVNGNLRSEPLAFQENVVETLRESVSVTGKRTKDGWLQVRLSTGKLAWAHPEVISGESEKEMEACLSRKGKVLEDVPTPPSS